MVNVIKERHLRILWCWFISHLWPFSVGLLYMAPAWASFSTYKCILISIRHQYSPWKLLACLQAKSRKIARGFAAWIPKSPHMTVDLFNPLRPRARQEMTKRLEGWRPWHVIHVCLRGEVARVAAD